MRYTTSSWWRTDAMQPTTAHALCAPGYWELHFAWRRSGDDSGGAKWGWTSPAGTSRTPKKARTSAYESQEARSQLQVALSQIDLSQRAVVVMHDLHGIAVPQIAEELGVPLNTVYSRLRLGRAKVAALLRGES